MRASLALFPLVLAAAAPDGIRLLERDHPNVEQGLEAYSKGDYEGALRAFDAARSELPHNATVELDRGNALYRLGRIEEAGEAYRRAAELDEGELSARDEYNLGTALANHGKRDEALRALRRALLKNPKDEQARHNYEVLLRRLPPPQNGPSDAGQDGGQDGGHSDAGTDAGPPDAGSPDGGQKDAGPPDGGGDGGTDGGLGDAGQDAGSDAGSPGDAGRDGGRGERNRPDGGRDAGADNNPDAGQETPSSGRDAGPQDAGLKLPDYDARDAGAEDVTPARMSREEAERMLDAVRQNEKNFQLWRFQQQKRPRKPNEKDW